MFNIFCKIYSFDVKVVINALILLVCRNSNASSIFSFFFLSFFLAFFFFFLQDTQIVHYNSRSTNAMSLFCHSTYTKIGACSNKFTNRDLNGFSVNITKAIEKCLLLFDFQLPKALRVLCAQEEAHVSVMLFGAVL